ncbi:ferredoxin [Nocardia sp. NPDC003963]
MRTNDMGATGRRITVDRSACAGHGLCYGRAPELVDCDDQGDPIVLRSELDADQLIAAESIVRSCPEHALSVEALPPPERMP